MSMGGKGHQLRLRALELFNTELLPWIDEEDGSPEGWKLLQHGRNDEHWPALKELHRCGLIDFDSNEMGFQPSDLAIEVWHGEQVVEQLLGLETGSDSGGLLGLTALIAQNVQIGDHNSQQVTVQLVFQKLEEEIQKSDAPEEQKKGAIAKIRAVLSDPIVQTALNIGGAFGPTMM